MPNSIDSKLGEEYQSNNVPGEPMLRKLTIVTTVLAPLVLLFADAPPYVWGQTANQGTIICCNQHIHVKGNWRGADRTANCEDYARTNTRANRELCAMTCLLRDAGKAYCRKETCKENPTTPGSVYAGVPGLTPRAQPSETAEAVGEVLYGATLIYSYVRKVDGTTWYQVNVRGPQGVRLGWVSEEDVFCELPPPPVDRRPDACREKVSGGMFVQPKEAGSARVYGEPTADSKVVATHLPGTRLVYREIRENQGEKWFFVTLPNRPAGWMKGSDLVCNRPGPPRRELYDPFPSCRGCPRPTAAHVAGARG